MSIPNIFAPRGTISVVATTVSTNLILTRGGIHQVYNKGPTAHVHVNFGSSTVTASSLNTPLPPLSVSKLNAENKTYVAVFCSTALSSAAVYLTCGDGF